MPTIPLADWLRQGGQPRDLGKPERTPEAMSSLASLKGAAPMTESPSGAFRIPTSSAELGQMGVPQNSAEIAQMRFDPGGRAGRGSALPSLAPAESYGPQPGDQQIPVTTRTMTGGQGQVAYSGLQQMAEGIVALGELVHAIDPTLRRQLVAATQETIANLRPELQQDLQREWASTGPNSILANPSGIVTQVVQQLPQLAATIVPATAVGARGAMAVRGAEAALKATTAGTPEAVAAAARVAEVTAKAVSSKAPAIAGAVAEGTQTLGQQYAQIGDAIDALPPGALEQSPIGQKLLAQGVPPDKLREEVTHAVATDKSLASATLSMIFGAAAGHYFGKVLGASERVAGTLPARTLWEGTKNRLKNAAEGAVVEGPLTEGPQSAIEQVGVNAALRKVDPSVALDSGVLEAALQGAGTGGPIGGALGGMRGGAVAEAQPQQPPPPAPPPAATAAQQPGTPPPAGPAPVQGNLFPPTGPGSGGPALPTGAPPTAPALPTGAPPTAPASSTGTPPPAGGAPATSAAPQPALQQASLFPMNPSDATGGQPAPPAAPPSANTPPATGPANPGAPRTYTLTRNADTGETTSALDQNTRVDAETQRSDLAETMAARNKQRGDTLRADITAALADPAHKAVHPELGALLNVLDSADSMMEEAYQSADKAFRVALRPTEPGKPGRPRKDAAAPTAPGAAEGKPSAAPEENDSKEVREAKSDLSNVRAFIGRKVTELQTLTDSEARKLSEASLARARTQEQQAETELVAALKKDGRQPTYMPNPTQINAGAAAPTSSPAGAPVTPAGGAAAPAPRKSSPKALRAQAQGRYAAVRKRLEELKSGKPPANKPPANKPPANKPPAGNAQQGSGAGTSTAGTPGVPATGAGTPSGTIAAGTSAPDGSQGAGNTAPAGTQKPAGAPDEGGGKPAVQGRGAAVRTAIRDGVAKLREARDKRRSKREKPLSDSPTSVKKRESDDAQADEAVRNRLAQQEPDKRLLKLRDDFRTMMAYVTATLSQQVSTAEKGKPKHFTVNNWLGMILSAYQSMQELRQAYAHVPGVAELFDEFFTAKAGRQEFDHNVARLLKWNAAGSEEQMRRATNAARSRSVAIALSMMAPRLMELVGDTTIPAALPGLLDKAREYGLPSPEERAQRSARAKAATEAVGEGSVFVSAETLDDLEEGHWNLGPDSQVEFGGTAPDQEIGDPELDRLVARFFEFWKGRYGQDLSKQRLTDAHYKTFRDLLNSNNGWTVDEIVAVMGRAIAAGIKSTQKNLVDVKEAHDVIAAWVLSPLAGNAGFQYSPEAQRVVADNINDLSAALAKMANTIAGKSTLSPEELLLLRARFLGEHVTPLLPPDATLDNANLSGRTVLAPNDAKDALAEIQGRQATAASIDEALNAAVDSAAGAQAESETPKAPTVKVKRSAAELKAMRDAAVAAFNAANPDLVAAQKRDMKRGLKGESDPDAQPLNESDARNVPGASLAFELLSRFYTRHLAADAEAVVNTLLQFLPPSMYTRSLQRLLASGQLKGARVLFGTPPKTSAHLGSAVSMSLVNGKLVRRGLVSITTAAFGVGEGNSKTLDGAILLHTLTHELTHIVTEIKISTDAGFRGRIESLMREARRRLPPSVYGLRNVHEFVAEFMANQQFRNMLKATPAGVPSIFARIVRAIRRALGFHVEPEKNVAAMLDSILTQKELADGRAESLVAQANKVIQQARDTGRIVNTKAEALDVLRSFGIETDLSPLPLSVADTAAQYREAVEGGAILASKVSMWMDSANLGGMDLDVMERKHRDLFNAVARRMGLQMNPLTALVRAIQRSGAAARDLLEQGREALGAAEQLSTADKLAVGAVMRDATMLRVHPDLALADPLNQHLVTPEDHVTHAAVSNAYNALSAAAKHVYAVARDTLKAAYERRIDGLLQYTGQVAQMTDQQLADFMQIRTLAELNAFESRTFLQPDKHGNPLILSESAIKATEAIIKAIRREGPYFPLTRTGEWVLVEQDDRTPKKEQIVSFFGTEHEANRFVESLKGAGAVPQDWKFAIVPKREEDLLPGELKQVGETITAAFSDPEMREVARNSITAMMAEASLRGRSLKREGIRGVHPESMLPAFRDYVAASSYAIGDLENGYDKETNRRHINTAAGAVLQVDSIMQGDANVAISQQDHATIGFVQREFAKRSQEAARDRNVGQLERSVGMLGFMTFLGGPAYWLLNALQNITVGVPVLAALVTQANQRLSSQPNEISYAKAGAALVAASRMLITAAGPGGLLAKGKSIYDVDTLISRLPARYADLARYLFDENVIGSTIAQEFGDMLSDSRFRSATPVKAVMAVLQGVPQVIEYLNRLSTAFAAYDLTQGSEDDKRLAARDATQTAHNNYSPENRARLLKTAPKPLGGAAEAIVRPIMMFKVYGVNLMRLIYGSAYDAFKGETPEQRQKARTMLFGLLASHTALGGIYGGLALAPVEMMGFMINALLPKDEEIDWGYEMDRWISNVSNEYVARVVTRGLPAALGVDFSSSINTGNMLFMLPDADLSKAGGAEQVAVGLLGPMASLAARNTRLVSRWVDNGDGAGDMLKLAAQLTPLKVVRDLEGASEIAAGMKTANGQEFMNAEESGGTAFSNVMLKGLLGLRPAAVSQRQDVFYSERARTVALENMKSQLQAQIIDSPNLGDRLKAWEVAREFNTRMRQAGNYKLVITSSSVRAAESAKETRQREYDRGQYTRYNRTPLF